MRTIDSIKEGFWIDSCVYARPLHDVRQYALNDVSERGDEEEEGVPHHVYEVWVDVSACGLDESQVRALQPESNFAMIDGYFCYLDALIHINGDLDEDEDQLKTRLWQEYLN